jgi:hypothetical protein
MKMPKIVNDEGEEVSWTELLPPEVAAQLGDKKFEDVGKLATAYSEIEAFQGQSLRIPTGEAGEEQWSAFNDKLSEKVPGMVQIPADMDPEAIAKIMSKLGKPEKAEDYGIEPLDGISVPEGYTAWAHAAGLTKGQAKVFAEKFLGSQAEQATTSKDKWTQEMAVLNIDWGETKANKIKTAVNLAKQTGAPSEFIADLEAGTVNASTLRWLDNINKQFGGEGSNFSVDHNPSDKTPVDLEMEINDIMARKEYFQSDAVGRNLQGQVFKLQERINTFGG